MLWYIVEHELEIRLMFKNIYRRNEMHLITQRVNAVSIVWLFFRSDI